MKIKYIRYFTIFFLTISSLSNVNSNALGIDKKVYVAYPKNLQTIDPVLPLPKSSPYAK